RPRHFRQYPEGGANRGGGGVRLLLGQAGQRLPRPVGRQLSRARHQRLLDLHSINRLHDSET
ncbi:unnamed protein product, partial [Ectocarpus sp. 12 AP-2014]